MRKSMALLVFLGASVLASGCLQKDTSHTLYLSPDGAARWVAVETDVFSDEADPARRLDEEQRYIGAALIGAHPLALGLKALNPDTPVSTTVLRDERPFHVVTTAGFGRADRMLERMFKESGIKASATISREGTRVTLAMQFDFAGGVQERESPTNVLLEELQAFRFVLTDGRFVAGGGFEVPDRSGRARISGEWMTHVAEALEARGALSLALTWDVGAPAAAPDFEARSAAADTVAPHPRR